jgi:hypothetical protein
MAVSTLPQCCLQHTHLEKVQASKRVVMLAHPTKENEDQANERCYRESERSEYACYTACLYHLCGLTFWSVELDEMYGEVAAAMSNA